jgi:hypothetical protein
MNIWKRYSFAWVTLALFAGSLASHYTFGMWAFAEEHGSLSGYNIEWARDFFENVQSEFLQLLWQVGALKFLFWAGSPQSRESDDRMEAKLDAILQLLKEEPNGKIS